MGKLRLIGTLCVAILVTAQCATVAQTSNPIKYIQHPKMDVGFDFSSEQKTMFVMADDWLCPDGLPITDIHWWGSYWIPPVAGGPYTIYSDMLPNAANGGISQFVIRIFDDVAANDPGNTLGFSHPGALLATYQFSGDANEQFYGKVVKQASPEIFENVYEYSVDLTNTQPGPFVQEKGKIYWLMVVATMDDRAKQWGWHEAIEHRNDYAVQGVWSSQGENWSWYIPCGGRDMSFALTVIPEPASLFALGAGVTCLAGFVIRKRRRSA